MEHVIAEPRSENPARLIHGGEVQCLIADRQEFCPKIEEFPRTARAQVPERDEFLRRRLQRALDGKACGESLA